MEQSESYSAIDLTGRKILIVDDDRSNVRNLADILRGAGCALAEADSDDSTLTAYSNFKPDLVLLAVAVSGIDGFEIRRRLRQIHGEGCAPIVFLTAGNVTAAVLECLAASHSDYLRSPLHAADVLARVRTHLHVRRLDERQQALLEQLNAARAANSQFLGQVAHDLRNPLGSIRGLADFLREGAVGQLGADQLELVNTIHATSQSMLSLVNDLLDVATIEAGELKISPESRSLAELLEQSVYLARIDGARKKIHLTLAVPTPEPPASIDAARIQQVINNLLSNAVKYSPPGSTITVEMHADAQRCGFSVKDQGPGIPENERGKLFKDFGRLSVKPTGGENSTGLGLAICRKIIEAHRGAIMAENLPDGGCEFRVSLPLAP